MIYNNNACSSPRLYELYEATDYPSAAKIKTSRTGRSRKRICRSWELGMALVEAAKDFEEKLEVSKWYNVGLNY